MLAKLIRNFLGARGYDVVRKPDDLEPEFEALRAHASQYTGSPVDKMYALFEAVRYVIKAKIPGEFVECGVGQGGSSVLAALTMTHFGDQRPMWLFDTFEGMPEPGAKDVSVTGRQAQATWEERKDVGWFKYTLPQVQAAMASTKYPSDRVTYVQGLVEETIPKQGPEQISILRLDTDFYESTLHELRCFYPRLSRGGVLFIDDYYAWKGARDAVEEYFAQVGMRPMLSRLTSGARVGVKV